LTSVYFSPYRGHSFLSISRRRLSSSEMGRPLLNSTPPLIFSLLRFPPHQTEPRIPMRSLVDLPLSSASPSLIHLPAPLAEFFPRADLPLNRLFPLRRRSSFVHFQLILTQWRTFVAKPFKPPPPLLCEPRNPGQVATTTDFQVPKQLFSMSKTLSPPPSLRKSIPSPHG